MYILLRLYVTKQFCVFLFCLIPISGYVWRRFLFSVVKNLYSKFGTYHLLLYLCIITLYELEIIRVCSGESFFLSSLQWNAVDIRDVVSTL